MKLPPQCECKTPRLAASIRQEEQCFVDPQASSRFRIAATVLRLYNHNEFIGARCVLVPRNVIAADEIQPSSRPKDYGRDRPHIDRVRPLLCRAPPRLGPRVPPHVRLRCIPRVLCRLLQALSASFDDDLTFTLALPRLFGCHMVQAPSPCL